MCSIHSGKTASLVRDCVLAASLSVVCSLLAAMPAAYARDGYALAFDGVDDYVDVPTSDYIFEDGDIFTIELWGRWFDDTRSLCSYRYHVQQSRFRTRGSAALTVRTQIQDQEWHHVAVVYDGSGGTKYLDLYVDGVPTDSVNTTGSPLSTYNGNTLRFGMTRHSSGEYSNCIMDEIRIWNTVRAQSEIREYMSTELRGGEGGLIGYWNFNDAVGTTVYDRSASQNDGTMVGATWTADAAPVATSAFSASSPRPAAGAKDVPRDVALTWTPGESAAPTNGHKVYLSESFSDVNDGIGGITQSDTSYTPSQRLDFNTTYYWRVDEVSAPPDSTVYPGDVWSFTTEPIAYAVQNITVTASSAGQADFGPEKTVDGSGLNADDLHSIGATDMWLSANEPLGAWIQYEFDNVCKLHEMWVWNSNQVFEPLFGFGMKDVTVEYSTNGSDWTTLAGVPQFTQAPGTIGYAHNTTVDFGGVAAKYVKLTATSNWGGVLPQYGLSEVRFFSIPVSAREPSPNSGADNVDPEVSLAWRAGREAATHNVYLSTDEQAVIDGNVPAVTVTGPSYSTTVDLSGTYYWRIDEVNEAETPAVWQGDVWSFSTPDSLVVDDFESYNDIDPPDPKSHRIFESWSDGYGIATNGALVGNDFPPYMERDTVRGGSQSLPLIYSNTAGATYSETTRTFVPGRDWTRYGVRTLVLYFHGTAGNTGQLYAKVNGVKVPYDGDAAAMQLFRWQQWNIDLASLGVNLQNVTTLAIGIDGGAAAGTLYVDDIELYQSAPDVVVSSEEIWIEAETTASILEPMQVYDDPTASAGKYISTDESVGNSSDNPPADGIATYSFTIAGGTYKISGRTTVPGGSNSFWVRIQGATIPAETEIHSSGWVQWDGIPDRTQWFWSDIFSDDDNENAVVFWTMGPGTYTLEIARCDDGARLDAIVISKVD